MGIFLLCPCLLEKLLTRETSGYLGIDVGPSSRIIELTPGVGKPASIGTSVRLKRCAELSGSFKELRAEFLIRRRLKAVDGAGDG